MSKGDGRKIAIKFDKALVGDVSGLTLEPVGGYKLDPNGTDWAFEQSATAGSERSSTYSADKAVDGNDATSWQPSYRVLSWHKVDFGEVRDIFGMVFRTPNSDGYPLQYTVEGSNDDASWAIVHQQSVNDSIGYAAWKEVEFAETVSYRYMRFTVDVRTGNYPGLAILKYMEPAPVGNEQAFTITGQQPLYTKIPSEELGPLIGGTYEVHSVEAHPTEANTILLTMTGLGKFRDVEEDLTVAYDMTKGNLSGLGGAVLSFEETFTPEDLERMINPYLEENVSVEITAFDVDLISVDHVVLGDGPYPNAGMRNEEEYQSGMFYAGSENSETISVSIESLSIELIHVDDMDP